MRKHLSWSQSYRLLLYIIKYLCLFSFLAATNRWKHTKSLVRAAKEKFPWKAIKQSGKGMGIKTPNDYRCGFTNQTPDTKNWEHKFSANLAETWLTLLSTPTLSTPEMIRSSRLVIQHHLNKKVGFPQDLAPLCFLQSRAFKAHLLLPESYADCHCTRVFQGKNCLSSPLH